MAAFFSPGCSIASCIRGCLCLVGLSAAPTELKHGTIYKEAGNILRDNGGFASLNVMKGFVKQQKQEKQGGIHDYGYVSCFVLLSIVGV